MLICIGQINEIFDIFMNRGSRTPVGAPPFTWLYAQILKTALCSDLNEIDAHLFGDH